MRISALCGRVGMVALLRAFDEAGREFDIVAVVATPHGEAGRARHLVVTIGGTTAALSFSETRWFADCLIHQPRGPAAADLECFGRLLLTMLAESPPGPHGLH